MKQALLLVASCLPGFFSGLCFAGEPVDNSTEVPVSARRDVVVTLTPSQLATLKAQTPQADLPDGMELQMVAAAPLVTHPMMGCLDDRGRLFVCDAVGLNWNKQQLAANPPNRILMLEDTDGDGVYDKSTVFADHMTFPQGACWLNGSLYVCSPPSLWKLTDTKGAGVADQREELVTGFEYTGNAADVHGPWLHPNGRLYWCHGRKGHKVVGRDGKVVHEGLASGIWSCKPDGTDVQWHSLGCGDNPVKVDFTPRGDVIGVQNLYYSQPRGDALVHWLYGGVYERADQLKAIEGLPRTLEHMPVMYNFGHVAVSGCCFWRSYQQSAGSSPVPSTAAPLQFLVTHFNTQRVVRMELTPDGATYKAAENEFLQLHDPDVHLTDIMEASDGSLLVLNTGGWFRIGCPSSLMAKPDVMGAIYRVKRSTPSGGHARLARLTPIPHGDPLAVLSGADAHACLLACEDLARTGTLDTPLKDALLKLLAGPLDPALEHAAMYALIAAHADGLGELQKKPTNLVLARRLLAVAEATTAETSARDACFDIACVYLDSTDADLSRAALGVVTRHPDADSRIAPRLTAWLESPALTARQTAILQDIAAALLAKPETQKLVARMLTHPSLQVQKAALNVIAGQTSGVTNETWLAPVETALAQAGPGDLPLLLDAVKKLKSARFDAKLQALAGDVKQPLSLRLRALDAEKGLKLTAETFTMLSSVLTGADSSAAARLQAAAMLAHAPLQKEQIAALAPVLASVGPLELQSLLGVISKCKDVELARTVALDLAKNPVIASQQESVYRTALSAQPPEIFETIILPALRAANAASDAKKRHLAPLAEKVIAQGDPKSGRVIYESGRSVCIACHQIGDKGRAIGPNLSHIGAIRTERDLLESIIFPSNTIARDYEAHIIETSDGQSLMGVIKSHTADGLLLVDAAGQEKSISDTRIVSNTTLTTSLMPMGLDQTLSEKDLCDLVAWLRSLK